MIALGANIGVRDDLFPSKMFAVHATFSMEAMHRQKIQKKVWHSLSNRTEIKKQVLRRLLNFKTGYVSISSGYMRSREIRPGHIPKGRNAVLLLTRIAAGVWSFILCAYACVHFVRACVRVYERSCVHLKLHVFVNKSELTCCLLGLAHSAIHDDEHRKATLLKCRHVVANILGELGILPTANAVEVSIKVH